MSGHVRRPRDRAELRINGVRFRASHGQLHLMTRFVDGALPADWTPDGRTLLSFLERGWVMRSRGQVVLTPAGAEAKRVVDAYLARKAAELDKG